MEGYDERLRQLQLVELDILIKFKELCEKYNLTYYLIGGTLLGAVRHKGFIPWDDDVDVAMPRPDYERFLPIAEKELKFPFAVQTKDKDKSFVYPIARICDQRKKVIRLGNLNVRTEYVSIDIFPMDAMPKNRIRFIIRKRRILFRKQVFILSEFSDFANVRRKRHGIEKLIFNIFNKVKFEKCFDNYKQYIKLQHLLKKYPYEKGRYIGNICLAWFPYLLKREEYEPGKKLEFEGIMFHVPEDYDALLRSMYGDYMKLPPENEREKHFVQIVD